VKTRCFDAAVSLTPSVREKSVQVLVKHMRSSVPASISFYSQLLDDTGYAQITTSRPIDVIWKDRFRMQGTRGMNLHGEGTVLNPSSPMTNRSKVKKTTAFLDQLNGSDRDMLLALTLYRGIKGLTEEEFTRFSGFSNEAQLSLAQKLEAEGKVKILTFSPLFILAQASFDFVNDRILAFIQELHGSQEDFIGVTPQRIKQRFSLHPKILSLSLGYLERTGKTQRFENRIVLAGFMPSISPEDEELLAEMEDLSLRGEFQLLSLQDLKMRLCLSTAKMDRMLALLIERKKVVKGKDGFMLHSKWLEEIIGKIRNSGLEEITVKDFKEMTGLTRKYAIPLLELLDQMGVTQRIGSTRKILTPRKNWNMKKVHSS
jgi:selenocysteine-specific elongation factor